VYVLVYKLYLLTDLDNLYPADGLASYFVYAIAIDAQGNKWFGTSEGVSKFDGTNWTTYTTANGLVSNSIEAIAIDTQGNKWIGTSSEYQNLMVQIGQPIPLQMDL